MTIFWSKFVSLGLKSQDKLNQWQLGNKSDARIFIQNWKRHKSIFSDSASDRLSSGTKNNAWFILITVWLNYNYNQKHYLDLVIHTWRFTVLYFNKYHKILSTQIKQQQNKKLKFHYFYLTCRQKFKKKPVCQIHSLIYFCNISFTSFNVNWALLKTVWFNLLPWATFGDISCRKKVGTI